MRPTAGSPSVNRPLERAMMSLADIEALRQKSSDEVTRQQERATELRDLLIDMEEAKTSYAEEITTAIREKHEWMTKQDGLRAEVKGLQGTVKELHEKLDQIQNEDIQLRAAVATLQGEKYELERQNGALVAQNVNLERAQKTAHAELSNLSDHSRELEGKEADLQQQVEGAHKDIETLSEERDRLRLSMKAESDTLTEQIKAAKTALAEVNKRHEARVIAEKLEQERLHAKQRAEKNEKKREKDAARLKAKQQVARIALAAGIEKVEDEWRAADEAAQAFHEVELAREIEGESQAAEVKRWWW